MLFVVVYIGLDRCRAVASGQQGFTTPAVKFIEGCLSFTATTLFPLDLGPIHHTSPARSGHINKKQLFAKL